MHSLLAGNSEKEATAAMYLQEYLSLFYFGLEFWIVGSIDPAGKTFCGKSIADFHPIKSVADEMLHCST